MLIPLVYRRPGESHGPDARLDLLGLALAGTSLFGVVWGVVRGNTVGWGGPEIAGSLLTAAFVLWELRAPAPAPSEEGQASGASNAVRESAAPSAMRCSPRSSRLRRLRVRHGVLGRARARRLRRRGRRRRSARRALHPAQPRASEVGTVESGGGELVPATAAEPA